MNLGVGKINNRLWVAVSSLLISPWLNYQAFAIHFISLISLSTTTPHKNAISSLLVETQKERNGGKTACSAQNLETLTAQLLRDLPAYANRATQRARRLKRSVDIYSYMLIAGRPEFTPLPQTSEYVSTESVEQVFFTTLERQYVKGKAVELQQFHWLFLTKAESGWQMVMMFSQTGSYPQKNPPTPPRETSNSAIGQAIKTWLRDCRESKPGR